MSEDSRATVDTTIAQLSVNTPPALGQHTRWRSPRLRPTAQCVRIRTATGSPSSSLRYDLKCSGFSGAHSVPESVSCAHRFAGERAVASSGIPELDEAESGMELPSTVIHLAKVRRARRRFIRFISTARLSLGGPTARFFLGLTAARALSSTTTAPYPRQKLPIWRIRPAG